MGRFLMNFFDASALYVSLGWQVFPLKPGSKEPWPGSRGVLDATADADVIAKWAQRDISSNVAIACGKSNLLVVDLDPRHGAWERMADWEREGRMFPRTVCAETRSVRDAMPKIESFLSKYAGANDELVENFSTGDRRDQGWRRCWKPP
jgi:hypothetical protein